MDQVSLIEVLFLVAEEKKNNYQLSQAVVMTDNYHGSPPFQCGGSFTVQCRVLRQRVNEG